MTHHELDPGADAECLADLVRGELDGPIVIRAPGEPADPAHLDALRRFLDGDLVGFVSPLPVAPGHAPISIAYATHPTTGARPPIIGLACPDLCVLSAPAAAALAPSLPEPSGTVRSYLVDVAARLVELGFHHVGSPGLARSWSPATVVQPAAPEWWRRYVAGLDERSNTLLEAHRSWFETRVRPMRVVLDGACMTPDNHTGTQRVVMELARWLVATRPGAEVSLAVPRDLVDLIGASVADGVRVVAREPSAAERHDVVYRPYQMLRANELSWFESAAPRRGVGQLDMIGFSNPSYHPSPEAFFLARNLQRRMMQDADVVTFISDYGRRAALAECPGLPDERLAVVSCGVDVEPAQEQRPVGLASDTSYVAMISATFSHKNRPHAMQTFARLCADTGYAGHLVIAGPEPYYGRSAAAEEALLRDVPEEIRSRIVRLGLVSEAEKWWIMRHASAVLYPSIVEGFGLVPFEAAAVGVPSLSFEGTALGEILGAGPATVATWSTTEWAHRLAGLLDDPARAGRAVAHVQDAAARYSWRRCAALTWEALDVAVALPSTDATIEEGPLLSRVSASSRRVARTLTARALALRLWHAGRRRIRRG